MVGAVMLVAVVVMVVRRHRSRILHPFTVHFATDDGREVHMRNRVASSGFRPEQYQRVEVRYDRAHPVRFEVRELRGAGILLVVVLVMMGIVFLALGTVLALVFGGFAGGGG